MTVKGGRTKEARGGQKKVLAENFCLITWNNQLICLHLILCTAWKALALQFEWHGVQFLQISALFEEKFEEHKEDKTLKGHSPIFQRPRLFSEFMRKTVIRLQKKPGGKWVQKVRLHRKDFISPGHDIQGFGAEAISL